MIERFGSVLCCCISVYEFAVDVKAVVIGLRQIYYFILFSLHLNDNKKNRIKVDVKNEDSINVCKICNIDKLPIILNETNLCSLALIDEVSFRKEWLTQSREL